MNNYQEMLDTLNEESVENLLASYDSTRVSDLGDNLATFVLFVAMGHRIRHLDKATKERDLEIERLEAQEMGIIASYDLQIDDIVGTQNDAIRLYDITVGDLREQVKGANASVAELSAKINALRTQTANAEALLARANELAGIRNQQRIDAENDAETLRDELERLTRLAQAENPLCS